MGFLGLSKTGVTAIVSSLCTGGEGGTTNHELLTNIQGGASGEHYHLTLIKYAAVQNLNTASAQPIEYFAVAGHKHDSDYDTKGAAGTVQTNLTNHINEKNPHGLAISDLSGRTAEQITTEINSATAALLDGEATLNTLKKLANAIGVNATDINNLDDVITALNTAFSNHVNVANNAHAIAAISGLADALAAKEASGTAAAAISTHSNSATAHSEASTTVAGFMSAEDKVALTDLITAAMPPETNPDAYVKTPNGWELRYRYGTSLASAGNGRFVGEKFIRVAVPANGFSDADDGTWTWDGVRWTMQNAGSSDTATPLSDSLPSANGTASAGTGTAAARYDHVHPASESSGTATKSAVVHCHTNAVFSLTSNAWRTVPIGQVGGTTYQSTETDPDNIVSVNASNQIVVAAAGKYKISVSFSVYYGQRTLRIMAAGNAISNMSAGAWNVINPTGIVTLSANDTIEIQVYPVVQVAYAIESAWDSSLQDGQGASAGYKCYMQVLVEKLS